MKYLHREVARNANKSAGRMNHFFGGRYKWSLISNEVYYWNAVKYVLRNPVEAGIVSGVEQYKYSSLNTISKSFKWNAIDFFNNEKEIDLCEEWLNYSFNIDQNESLKKALRRRIFKPSKLKCGRLVAFAKVRPQKGTVTY